MTVNLRFLAIVVNIMILTLWLLIRSSQSHCVKSGEKSEIEDRKGGNWLNRPVDLFRVRLTHHMLDLKLSKLSIIVKVNPNLPSPPHIFAFSCRTPILPKIIIVMFFYASPLLASARWWWWWYWERRSSLSCYEIFLFSMTSPLPASAWWWCYWERRSPLLCYE